VRLSDIRVTKWMSAFGSCQPKQSSKRWAGTSVTIATLFPRTSSGERCSRRRGEAERWLGSVRSGAPRTMHHRHSLSPLTPGSAKWLGLILRTPAGEGSGGCAPKTPLRPQPPARQA
jgi:hypothetical protein